MKLKRSKHGVHLSKKDLIILLVIMILYSAVAFYRLGYCYAPETSWTGSEGQNIFLDLGSTTDISTIDFYIGNYAYYDLSVSGKDTVSDAWTTLYTSEVSEAFSWHRTTINDAKRYIMVTFTSPQGSLLEAVIKDTDGNIVVPVNSDEYRNLFDEQDMCQETITFMSGTYFDEIYHARTAYEYLHGITSYENTHPPLGKIIIASGIMIFGMNPFGWRFMGTLFGVLMIPVIYLFAKKLFEKTWLSSVVCILFTFDFMHFAQTRIATIDVYITFFIILMYYFMYEYVSLSFYDTSLKRTLLPLGVCGITMGLGCASKWTGCYAGAGLGIIFLIHMFNRFKEYRYAIKHPDDSTDGIEHKHIIQVFPKYTILTVLFCTLFFIIIPVGIYVLSYIPFRSYIANEPFLLRMIHNQTNMFNYHSGLKATHPYSSHWYQWPTMVRPILFYSISISDKIGEGISSFGNPAVWWVGIPAASYALYKMIADNDKKAGFLMIGYGAQFIPWMLVPRYTFIYHYFPSTPFVVLIIGYCLNSFYSMASTDAGRKKVICGCIAYASIAVLLFIMFYPVLSGLPVNKEYVALCLRWFKHSWTLVV